MNNRQQVSARISEGFFTYKREIEKGHSGEIMDSVDKVF